MPHGALSKERNAGATHVTLAPLWAIALRETVDGVLIVDARLEHCPIVFANDAFLQLTGYERDEILGRSFDSFQGTDAEQDGLKTLRRAVRKMEAVKTVLRSYRKDGSMFWAEVSITPIKDGHGGATHFVAFQRDVTEAIEREGALLSALADKQAILEGSPDIICRLSDEGTFEEIGAAITSILGWKPEELKGRSILTIVPPARVDFVREQLQRIKDGLNVRGSRREYLTKDGRAVSIEWSVSRIIGGGIMCVGRDVTQEKQFSSQLDYLAYRDPLTDLPNRLDCLLELSRQILGGTQHRGRISLLMLDLDRFKDVNESFGQEVGDSILCKLGKRFKALSASVEFVGRFGGTNSCSSWGARIPRQLKRLHGHYWSKSRNRSRSGDGTLSLAPASALRVPRTRPIPRLC
ncbi:PAS domain S-box protein [Cupriavidus sp. D39]|nr:PAS domain S-box protein [Cupriavidus sp. D39]MCY0852595.1 PAS domain S-box protein [Cupriavidus sp. D39]